ncbi:uncharacterized membrane protein YraQ (UPF0718 family) [Anaerosolibacter carboniphilus]|uniref:Uncharacterized membrane protein YraQ (UPF0718 family) n=1 Tax=Anaerosolibacter carboniphilus TaxID=1417629 RepID=A0A841KSA7_9FIRM|nr:permease [Anaerosolibacter carboniphilus]MBB6216307.1 uncharacterized membrane protein YraQ (UPF0718 family) [Anaerosolibacter carboniphilus]
MNNFWMYLVTIVLLLISAMKDKKKTKQALMKAWKTFENILPELLGIIMLVGLVLAIVNPEVVSKVIGSESGWFGVILSAVIGAITLIPGFVAFPTAALLLQNGAGYMQIAAFVSTLMMVGVITAPVEMKYFGKKLTVLRNTIAFVFSFVVAYIIGRVVG